MPFGSRVATRICIFAVAVLAGSSAFAQEPSRSLSGNWTATAGSQVFRGTWTAQPLPQTPNAVQGSWTLIAGSGELVAEGTWSARKSAGRWHGSWTARAVNGRALSGTWDAAISDSGVKTFTGMFEATMKKQISGAWHTGGDAGNWWLQGSRP